MYLSALRRRYQTEAETFPCPLARYNGRLELGTRRARVTVMTHPEPNTGYLAEVQFDGRLVSQINQAATATIALLGAYQQAANRGYLELLTPTLAGHTMFTMENTVDFHGLTLRRLGAHTYVVIGAQRIRCSELTRWVAFCIGFEDQKGEPNSFEALKRCVLFMDAEGMIH